MRLFSLSDSLLVSLIAPVSVQKCSRFLYTNYVSATLLISLMRFFLVMSLGFWGFTDRSVGKESICNTENAGSIPGLGRSPGEGLFYPLQYS